MDGVRTVEGGEGVTEAMIRARIRVDRRRAGGLQALLGAPMVACSGCGERDGGIGHGERNSRTGMARVGGAFGWPVDGSVADGHHQAGSGIACSRAMARLNCSSHGQRWGRCRVNRRAERVSRPARAKNRRRRVLVVTICSPRPRRAVQRARLCAILVTTNLPFDEWTEAFGSERLTGALLDRLTHHVHILEMNGESYRLKRSRESAVSQPSDELHEE